MTERNAGIEFCKIILSFVFYSREETEIKYLLFPLFQLLQGVTPGLIGRLKHCYNGIETIFLL